MSEIVKLLKEGESEIVAKGEKKYRYYILL